MLAIQQVNEVYMYSNEFSPEGPIFSYSTIECIMFSISQVLHNKRAVQILCQAKVNGKQESQGYL